MKLKLTLLYLFASLTISSQSILVLDNNTEAPLIGANISSRQNQSTTTDENGIALLSLRRLPDTLTITYIGYASKTILLDNNISMPMTVRMIDNLLLETMTVTASKYERRLSESTVSIDILKPDIIASINTINIDDAIDKVSGVQMIDGQANIRGGSGYSYGAGSRVMLLIDDVPALQVDAGFPNWGDVPVENIGQVEIVKGASSALYGSAALNGIINIRTGSPTLVPQTRVSTAYTYYGDPEDISKKWWKDTTRYAYNLSLVHLQKFKNLDLTFSGVYNKLESFNQATYQNRGRATIKLKYRISDKASLNLNSIVNTSRNSDFFIWQFSDSLAYRPFPGSAGKKDNFRFFIDPSLVVEDKYGNVHKLLTRYHRIINNNADNQSNRSHTLYGEYQFQRNFKAIDAVLTSGILTSNTDTDAELFGDTTFNTKVFASYAQFEKTFFDRLNLVGGLRYEYNQQNTPEMFNGITVPGGQIKAGKWISRFGASYEYMPFSAVRASWGQGYRFPTITERFITTTFGSFKIESNPGLVPESGWTAEFGVKQGIQVGGFRGFIDGAAFMSRYEDMMEFTFAYSGFNPAFTAQNIGNTEIKGLEIGLFGSLDIGKVKLSAFGGYTYIDPKYRNYEGNTQLQESLSADQNVLKYRSKHITKMDIQADYKGFSFGMAFLKSSHIINVDAVLEGRGIALGNDFDLLGLKEYRSINNHGFSRVDTRFAYAFSKFKLSFIIGNVLNNEYTLRPALLEEPRNYTLRVDYVMDWKQ